MYEFWYNYVKPQYGEKAKFCYIGFIIHVKTDVPFKDIAEDVETRFDTYEFKCSRLEFKL